METETIERILHINRKFYQTFAKSFSETRKRLQPGVLKAIDGIAPQARVLDLGCGNGLLATELGAHGHMGLYTGVDSSDELLAEARQVANHPRARFTRSDFANPGWFEQFTTTFDLVVAFAVIHHLPGRSLRERWFRDVRMLTAPNGTFSFSHWDFLSSSRLKGRIIPWSQIGIEQGEVESGDYLLDWRRDGVGLRYIHAFEKDEVESILSQVSFDILDHYQSDGENGRMGKYYIARPV